jgi:hypothetical protein
MQKYMLSFDTATKLLNKKITVEDAIPPIPENLDVSKLFVKKVVPEIHNEILGPLHVSAQHAIYKTHMLGRIYKGIRHYFFMDSATPYNDNCRGLIDDAHKIWVASYENSIMALDELHPETKGKNIILLEGNTFAIKK